MGCVRSKLQCLPCLKGQPDLEVPKGKGTGTLGCMYKQDPSVKTIGYRPVWIPDEVKPGPATDDIEITGMPDMIQPSDENNNYFFLPYTWQFDSVHCLAAVNHVLTMYRRGLRRMGYTEPELHWQWGDEPIKVYPWAGRERNAFYSREERCLIFCYFKPSVFKPWVYTCRSFDVVTHEAGHAILDSLKPGYFDNASNNPQTLAFHESFADLTVIFAMMEQMDMCESIIVQSKGNLHAKSFFSSIAEEFGTAIGRKLGLRNADTDVAIDEVTDQVHDLSKVFTGAIYDIIAEDYEYRRNMQLYDPAETLFKVGKRYLAIFVFAVVNSPEKDADFADIAEEMVNATNDDRIKQLIRKHFEKRKVYKGSPAKPIATIKEGRGLTAACGSIEGSSKEEILAMIKKQNKTKAEKPKGEEEKEDKVEEDKEEDEKLALARV